LAALAPRNAAEAMLAAQAVSLHDASMDCYRRAAAPGLSDAAAMRILGRALALSRMSLRMSEALAKSKKEKPVLSQVASQAAAAPPTQPEPASSADVALPAASTTQPKAHTAGQVPAANRQCVPAVSPGRQTARPLPVRNALLASTVIPGAGRIAV
jgi:hypothetical protein